MAKILPNYQMSYCGNRSYAYSKKDKLSKGRSLSKAKWTSFINYSAFQHKIVPLGNFWVPLYLS